MQKQIVLIDSLNLAWRMQYTHQHLETKEGVKTGVTYGMLRTILDIHKKIGPSSLIWFWEGNVAGNHEGPPIRSWRKTLAPDYKGTRKKSPDRDAVMQQAGIVREILETLGYAQFYVPGLEADDLIGVVSQVLSDEDEERKVYILTNDRDLFQCIDDTVSVLRPGGGRVVTCTARTMREEFSVGPVEWASYKALVGDSTDNYKGIEGVGPKNALKMLADGVNPSKKHWDDQTEFVQKTYGAKLKARWADAYKCYQLSYIPRSLSFKHFTDDVRHDIKKQLKQLPKMQQRVIPKGRFQTVLGTWTTFCAENELLTFIPERRKFFATAQII